MGTEADFTIINMGLSHLPGERQLFDGTGNILQKWLCSRREKENNLM